MSHVIEVEALSKRYRLGRNFAPYFTLRESLMSALLPSRSRRRGDSEIWALRDVSLAVEEGEAFGIIGRNGAGKTTLLRVLARITEPTAGVARTRGRVGALLEVGTGFHPELSGRDNIYLNGAILGMPRTEIKRKFDEIVSFADLARFLDTPLKRYSAGMYMRLAFAVAAHLNAEILVVDEVLAVGDVEFQKKCLGKMGEVASEGRTVLFVSHNMMAIDALCDRVIRLDLGRVVDEGRPTDVISSYLSSVVTDVSERSWDDLATAPGNEKIRLRRARVQPLDGSSSDQISVRTPFVLEFEYWNPRPSACLNLAVQLYNEQGVLVLSSAPQTGYPWKGRPLPIGLFRDSCRMPGDLLNDGIHRVELLVIENEAVPVYEHEDILVFHVHDTTDFRGAWYGEWQGAVRPLLSWSTELVEGEVSEAPALDADGT